MSNVPVPDSQLVLGILQYFLTFYRLKEKKIINYSLRKIFLLPNIAIEYTTIVYE